MISGKMGMHPFVRGFMFVWFSGVVLVGGTMFLASVGAIIAGSGSHHQDAWTGAIMPPIMLAFGFGLVRFGRYLSSDDARFLTDFLIRTLDANELRRDAAAPLGR